ncbi:MAG: thiamine phosphate synthase [Janthinobacterium lividum]
MKLPRLYPIADIDTLSRQGLGLRQFVQQVLAGGAEVLQLRDKHGSPQQILRHAAILTEEAAGMPCIPVMNDRADLALLAGWTAVHVGHLDLPPDAVRRVFGLQPKQAICVGVSTHTAEQVVAANMGSADYIAVGPVFATGTKADAEPVIGLEGVRRARTLTRKPIVAIGGITRANAAAVWEAGADSVAVIGGLFAEGETVERVVRDFLERLR